MTRLASDTAVKGWCPGALRPMMSGDGLIVRIRPRLGRLTASQAYVLCDAAEAFGSGIIELTSRANVQLRGVTEETHQEMLDRLRQSELIDESVDDEVRNNIIVTPFWQMEDDTCRIATELRARLHELPELPTKFGFAIDADDMAMLRTASADLRVERGDTGDLMVRCDGASYGRRVTVDEAVDAMIAICRWFVQTGGAAAKRMRCHVDAIDAPSIEMSVPSGPAAPMPEIGLSSVGPVYGAAFGRTSGTALASLMQESGAVALRITPWRRFILEGGRAVESNEFITEASDPLQRIDACPGAPYCASATVETHRVAKALAGVSSERVHVSGCAKGCARSAVTPITLVGREGRFDVVNNGRTSDVPDVVGLDPAAVVSWLGAR